MANSLKTRRPKAGAPWRCACSTFDGAPLCGKSIHDLLEEIGVPLRSERADEARAMVAGAVAAFREDHGVEARDLYVARTRGDPDGLCISASYGLYVWFLT